MSWISGVRARVRAFTHPSRADAELAEEIAHHLDLETARNIELGMTPGEARRAAMVRFGGVARVHEEHRDASRPSWLTDFAADMRFAIRSLRRTPIVAAAAVITIALGVGANVAIFSVVNAVILQPLPFPHAGRLFMITEENASRGWHHQLVSTPNYLDLRDAAPAFSNVAAYVYSAGGVALTGLGEARNLRELDVTGDFFATLGVSPELGRTFGDADTWAGRPHTVVMSHAAWQREFAGDRSIVGRFITLDDSAYQVIGVMPPGFEFPAANIDLWVGTQWPTDVRGRPEWRRTRWLNVVGRLAPPATIEVANTQLKTVAERLARDYPEEDAHIGLSVTPLQDFIVGDTRLPLVVLLAAVAILMLIACANVGNLMLIRATARHREHALRLALGAGRFRLARQAIAESFVMSVTGAAVGFVVGWAGTHVLVAFQPDKLLPVSTFGVDGAVLVYSATLAIISTMLFAVAPAVWLRHRDPAEALKENAPGGTTSRGLKRWGDLLVVGEVALALILTTGAGLLARSFSELARVDIGFNPHHVLGVSINASGRGNDYAAFFDELMNRVLELRGVTAVAQAGVYPLNGTYAWSSDFIARGRAPNDYGRELPHFYVSPSYFALLQVPLKRGRLFESGDRATSPKVVVINETFARGYFAGQDPIGQTLCFAKAMTPKCEWYRIIGVVGDVHDRSLDLAPRAAVYESTTQRYLAAGGVLIRTTGDPLALVPSVRAIVQELDPRIPITSVRTLEELRDRNLARTRFFAFLLGLFATIGLILAVVGVYGVIAQRASYRTRETGIRLALGAQASDVQRLFVGDGMRPALIGIACGGLAAFFAARLAAKLLFNIAPYDPLAFALAALLLGGTTALATWIPALRASRADPVATLRAD